MSASCSSSRTPRGPCADIAALAAPSLLQISDPRSQLLYDAAVRYLVLPRRPAGTEGFDEEALAALVTRDAMIGVIPVRVDAERAAQ